MKKIISFLIIVFTFLPVFADEEGLWRIVYASWLFEEASAEIIVANDSLIHLRYEPEWTLEGIVEEMNANTFNIDSEWKKVDIDDRPAYMISFPYYEGSKETISLTKWGNHYIFRWHE